VAQYFLGVDGGQSSTTALVGDASGRVSAAEARARFMGAIGGCVRQALSIAGLAEDTAYAAACMGFSGGPGDKQALIDEMFRIEKCLLTTDMPTAVVGAHAGRPGIITNAGTGSFALARRHDGTLARVGGWGYVYGDEGAAFDISRQALRAALAMEEGWGPATSLRAVLLEATGAAAANDLLHWCYTPEYPRSKVATWSRLVDQAAQAGDAVAGAVLDRAARELADQTIAARGMAFDASEPVRSAYIGGVFRCERLLRAFTTQVEADGRTSVAPPIYGPAAGALLEAYRLAGLTVELTSVPAEK
jgi:N-acetylglucosamine kinase-like BadF-type ATPase